jgi:hypothetical protein
LVGHKVQCLNDGEHGSAQGHIESYRPCLPSRVESHASAFADRSACLTDDVLSVVTLLSVPAFNLDEDDEAV